METLLELLNKTIKFYEKKGVKSARLEAEKLFCVALNMQRIDLYFNYNMILSEEDKDKIRKYMNNINVDDNLKKYLIESINYLEKKNIKEASLITELIFSKVLNVERMLLFTKYNDTITEQQKDKIREYLIKIANNMPYQYIFNNQNFYGRDFYVDRGVLIPRYDTEILVENVIKLAKDDSIILDIGVGSGVIAITLALELKNSKVLGVDISERAIEISEKNKKLLNANNVKIIKSDLFENISYNEFDIIVSNPPYISNNELEEMGIDVIEYEPHEALFASANGLFYYYEISKKAKNYLKNGGYIAFEIGYKQSDAVCQILREFGYIDIQVKKDLNDLDRVVIARKG